MENFLALFELDAVCEIVSAYGLRNCGNLFAVDADTALLDQATRFALALCKLAQNEKIDNADAALYASELGDISIYSINTDAFSSLAATLKSLTLSSAVALMEGTAFSECIALENIYVSSDNMYFTSVNGVLYSNASKILVKYTWEEAVTSI